MGHRVQNLSCNNLIWASQHLKLICMGLSNVRTVTFLLILPRQFDSVLRFLTLNVVTVRFSKVDPYGFERPDDFDYENYEDFMAHYLSVLAKRSQKWESRLHRHSLGSTKGKKCTYYPSSPLSPNVCIIDHHLCHQMYVLSIIISVTKYMYYPSSPLLPNVRIIHHHICHQMYILSIITSVTKYMYYP